MKESDDFTIECCDHAIQKEEERMIEVTDNWYPCFDGNKIFLKIYLSWSSERSGYPAGGSVRMIATGADDTYVKMEYVSDGEYSLHCLEDRYSHWKKHIFDKVPNGVDKKWFYEHGFVQGI